MNQLDEFKVPNRGTILGNPLLAPNESMLVAFKKRMLWRVTPTFHKPEFQIAQFQSGLQTQGFYDFFMEEAAGNMSLVGRGYRNALLRVLPEGDSFEEIENLRDGVGALEESLEKGFLEQLPFSSAIMKVIDVIIDHTVDQTELFDRLITQQIETLGDIIEEQGVSEKMVLQVTSEGEGNIGMFPKGYFDDGNDGERKWLSIGEKIREAVGGLLPDRPAIPVPISISK